MTNQPGSLTTPSPELCSSGLVFITPLSDDNREKANIIMAEAARRLRVNDVWTPHQDITHGRILERKSGVTEKGFSTIVALAKSALTLAMSEQGIITVTLDTFSLPRGAAIMHAKGDNSEIAALRTVALDTFRQIHGCENAFTKNIGAVHTTLGRLSEAVPLEDLARVTAEIRELQDTERLPKALIQPVGQIVIAKEERRYVLTPLETVQIGHDR